MVERVVRCVVELADVVVAGDEAGAVRVSIDELQLIGVSRRHDDAAEVHQRDVEREQCRLLTAVCGVGRRERRVCLVGELALCPQAAERVEEAAQLRRDRTESGR
jgi:hypothetical protein